MLIWTRSFKGVLLKRNLEDIQVRKPTLRTKTVYKYLNESLYVYCFTVLKGLFNFESNIFDWTSNFTLFFVLQQKIKVKVIYVLHFLSLNLATFKDYENTANRNCLHFTMKRQTVLCKVYINKNFIFNWIQLCYQKIVYTAFTFYTWQN